MASELESTAENFPDGEVLDSESALVQAKYAEYGNGFYPGHQNSAGNSGGWGGPSKYREDFVRQALIAAKTGMTMGEICQLFDVSYNGLLIWIYQHPELGVALKEGKDLWDSRVEASLAHSAIGYSHPSEKIFMTKDGDIVRAPYTKVYPPNVAAAALWLANRKPKEWSKRAQDEDRSVTVNVEINAVRTSIENKLALLAARKEDLVEVPKSSESSD